MKKGYHSTQSKVYRTIPRSIFLGIAVGYAAGLIVGGVLATQGHRVELIGAAAGFAVGWLIDHFLFAEKDEDTEQSEEQEFAVMSAESRL